MSDIYGKKKRSEVMSRVQRSNTAPEMIVRRSLHKQGFRYRLHVASLPGRPDIVLPKYRAAIFVNGCFWHQHDCGKGTIPKQNKQFWKRKLRRNVERDKENTQALTDLSYRVLTVWECEVKDTHTLATRLAKELVCPSGTAKPLHVAAHQRPDSEVALIDR